MVGLESEEHWTKDVVRHRDLVATNVRRACNYGDIEEKGCGVELKMSIFGL